jgi:CBS domain-containing protein
VPNKEVSMRVGGLLKRKEVLVITIREHETVAQAARLLIQHGIGALPVTDSKGAPVGLISERDLVQVLDSDEDEVRSLPASRIMRAPAPSCGEDATVREVMRRMTRHRLRHLIVVTGEELVGVISVGDLVKHRLEELETETGVLRDYVAGQRARR